MDELWVLTVGSTDVQLPLWRQDQFGAWAIARRFEVRTDTREVHEKLLLLLSHGLIDFGHPTPKDREEGGSSVRLRLEVVPEGEDLLFEARFEENNRVQGCDHPRIRQTCDSIEAPGDKLPLVFPKVAPLVDFLIEDRRYAEGSVSVLVLNTHRDPSLERSEPIASGPLAATVAGHRLGIASSQAPGLPRPGTSAWMDILKDKERVEEDTTRAAIVQRLIDAFTAWEEARPQSDEWRVSLSTSGGLPILKEVTERVAASFFGEDRIRLIEAPARGVVQAHGLGYSQSWTERLALRFNFLEGLRRGDLVEAYGFANRLEKLGVDWAQQTLASIGPLVNLNVPAGPGITPLFASLDLEDFELKACQIEVCLAGGDIEGAALGIGVFFEQVMWFLLERSQFLLANDLGVDRDQEAMYAVEASDRAKRAIVSLVRERMLRGDPTLIAKQPFPVEGLLRENWIAKLADHRDWRSSLPAAAAIAKDLLGRYSRPNRQGLCPRVIRNRFGHGARVADDLAQAGRILQTSGMVAGWERPLGENFLGLHRGFLRALRPGRDSLADEVKQLLRSLHDRLRKSPHV